MKTKKYYFNISSRLAAAALLFCLSACAGGTLGTGIRGLNPIEEKFEEAQLQNRYGQGVGCSLETSSGKLSLSLEGVQGILLDQDSLHGRCLTEGMPTATQLQLIIKSEQAFNHAIRYVVEKQSGRSESSWVTLKTGWAENSFFQSSKQTIEFSIAEQRPKQRLRILLEIGRNTYRFYLNQKQ